jgi:hypothetical protein
MGAVISVIIATIILLTIFVAFCFLKTASIEDEKDEN